MGKAGFFLIGAAVGTAVGLAIDYVFGPTKDAVFDERYRSRWDHALEEGERAADAREADLRRQFTTAKRSRPQIQSDETNQLPGENSS